MSHESTDSRLRVSRRAVLAGAAAAGVMSAAPIGLGRAHAATEFDQLRQKRVQGLVGGGIDPKDPDYAAKLSAMDSAAATLVASMDTSASRTALWPDAPMPDISNVSLSYGRIQTIALSWATQGTSQYGDSQLADDLASGLKFLHDNGYNQVLKEAGNWWFWEIGIPKQLGDLYSLLYDHVAAADLADAMATVAHFVPDPNYRYAAKSIIETGANRSDKAIATVLRGILSADGGVITLGRDALSATSRAAASTACSATSPQATASTPTAPSSSTATCPTSEPTATSHSVASPISSLCSADRAGTSLIPTSR